MNPVLVERDLLEVRPYNIGPIRAGDVVVFYSPDDGTIFAHRVISVGSDGIRTRGDNNIEDDPWSLDRTAIIGKVNAVIRHGRCRIVSGGFWGQISAKLFHYMYKLKPRYIRLTTPFYYMILRQKKLLIMGASFINPRVILFESKNKENVLLLSGKKVIGHYDKSNGQWHINCFYRLFIDDSSLPRFDRMKKYKL